MRWERVGGEGYVCGFLLLMRDHQRHIDQLVKIPNKTTPHIPWSRGLISECLCIEMFPIVS